MRIFLLTSGVLTGLGGLAIFSESQSAIQEIEAFILFVVAAVCISGAAIVDVLNNINEKLSISKQGDQEEATQQRSRLSRLT